MRRHLCGVSAILLMAACGQSPVVDAVPAAPPYEGPLYVEVTAAPHDEKADRGGAAGLAVDCDTAPVGYTEPDPYENSVSRSPTAALERGLKEPNRGAGSGLREARREDDRVLYVYESGWRIKQAMIVRRGTAIDGNTGWYVESWARCDWAELPMALADNLGLQVWNDNSGRRISTTRVASAPGPEHCNWEDMTFLSIDGGDLNRGQTYLEHPHPGLYPDYLGVPYSARVELPSDAQDTGYQYDGRHLWLAPNQSRAFVGTPDSVAVWPRTIQPLGCA